MAEPLSCGALAEQVSGALAAYDRAEALLLEMLAQGPTANGPAGPRPADTARWEELLHHVASLHARAVALRARLQESGDRRAARANQLADAHASRLRAQP